MLDKVLTCIFGVIGATFVFAITQYLIKKKEGRIAALAFLNELNSNIMVATRRKAFRAIKKEPTTPLDKLKEIDPDGADEIVSIMRFYRKVWLNISLGQIDKRIIFEVADNFYKYYYIYFQTQLPNNWDGKLQLDSLAKWFERNLPESRHLAFRNKRLEEKGLLMISQSGRRESEQGPSKTSDQLSSQGKPGAKTGGWLAIINILKTLVKQIFSKRTSSIALGK